MTLCSLRDIFRPAHWHRHSALHVDPAAKIPLTERNVQTFDRVESINIVAEASASATRAAAPQVVDLHAVSTQAADTQAAATDIQVADTQATDVLAVGKQAAGDGTEDDLSSLISSLRQRRRRARRHQQRFREDQVLAWLELLPAVGHVGLTDGRAS